MSSSLKITSPGAYLLVKNYYNDNEVQFSEFT